MSSEESGGFDGSKRKGASDTPSRVLHVRGLPIGVTEPELLSICQPFGAVDRILLLASKHQAFVQMESLDAAVGLISRYAASTPQIRGRAIYFQYSSRNEVRTSSSNGSVFYGGLLGGGGGATETPNNILIVSILNARMPVSLDNIADIFKPYGQVYKIIMFVKDNVLKVLVQMTSVDSAITAKQNLEGKDLFQNCCHLRIGYSKLKDLVVKQNGPRMRDFSFPHSAAPTPAFPHPYLMHNAGYTPAGAFNGFAGYDSKSVLPYSGGSGSVLLVNNLVPEKITTDKLFILFGVYGDVLRVKILFNKRETAMVQMSTPQQAHQALLHLNHLSLWGKELTISISKHNEIALPRAEEKSESMNLTKDYSTSPIHRFKHRAARNLKNLNSPSQVLHVSNLPESATEAQLRALFGADQASATPAVQFFKSDRKMAYVRMESVQDAVIALMKLHNHKLAERYIRVSFSHKDAGVIHDSDTADE